MNMIPDPRTLPIKITTSIVLGLVVFASLAVSTIRQSSDTALPVDRNLASLPEDLTTLKEATGYSDWDRVQGFSRSLKHHRQFRFHKDSNVFIAETGSAEGQIDVVEVILMPPNSSEKTEFALYDPKTGKRILRYPDSIKFDVFGIHGGSKNPAPGICISCHTERHPLIALVPWSQALEGDLNQSRATGQGIRPDLMVPHPNNEATRDRMNAFNQIMQDRFPNQISDIRNWMAIRTQQQAEQETAPTQ
ncbi:MAG: hypothetical protein ACSHX8_07910 [Opitutaceae bacterium]